LDIKRLRLPLLLSFPLFCRGQLRFTSFPFVSCEPDRGKTDHVRRRCLLFPFPFFLPSLGPVLRGAPGAKRSKIGATSTRFSLFFFLSGLWLAFSLLIPETRCRIEKPDSGRLPRPVFFFLFFFSFLLFWVADSFILFFSFVHGRGDGRNSDEFRAPSQTFFFFFFFSSFDMREDGMYASPLWR